MTPFNIFQLAYVTDDIDAGVRLASDCFGIGTFQINRSVNIETSSGIAHAHFAMAFLGNQQIEIIQPDGGADAVYRDGIQASHGALTFHHVGALFTSAEEWRAALADIAASGEPVPVKGSFGDLMDYVYVDHRAACGHYLEYMYRKPAGATIFDQVPHF